VNYRILIVDDEPIARRGVRRLLEREKDVEIIGEASNGRMAVEAIERDRPDVVFLDIQMPEMTGIEVVQSLDKLPAIVFLTAYDEYAVRAFDVSAIDYVLKPIDPDRFATAMQRVRERRQEKGSDLEQRLGEIIAAIRPPAKYLERIAAKSSGKITFIAVEELVRAEAEENYIRLYTARGEFLIRETLSNLEAQLDPTRFVRIRRSAIVRIEAIREMQPILNGSYQLVLSDGTRVASSRRFRDQLERLFSNVR
jgi:two-component system LytT family response regulator